MRPIIWSVLLVTALFAVSSAQNRLPQEYISADEIITLSPDMNFEEAFQILSNIAFKKEGKTIIDPSKRKGKIGVEIVNLPWKKAFEVILKANRLSYLEHQSFYEVTGEVSKTEPGKEEITINSREIRIEAIFFEGDRRALAESGIDWSVLRSGNTLSGSFNVSGGSAVSDEIVEGDATYNTTQEGADYTITGMLRAFESKNLGRILAQPQVVVVSGREGRIQVGQDFSIKTRDFAGNVIDNFFSTGTILSVTPVAYSENGVNFIHLRMHAERSNAIPDAVSTTINKSQADTQVLLLDGECTAVGGLFSRDYKTVRKGIPYLKDLPWWVFGLKFFFGYNLKEVTDKELLVVLRASLLPELKVRTAAPMEPTLKVFEKGRDDFQRNFNGNWNQAADPRSDKTKEIR